MNPSTLVDPITLAVVKGDLEQIVDEMDAIIVRAAFSRHLGAAGPGQRRLPRTGEVVAQGRLTLPIFMTAMQFSVQAAMAAAGRRGGFRPGDIYIPEQPYLGGTHPPDVKLVMPVFQGEEPGAAGGVWPLERHRGLDAGGVRPGRHRDPPGRPPHQPGPALPGGTAPGGSAGASPRQRPRPGGASGRPPGRRLRPASRGRSLHRPHRPLRSGHGQGLLRRAERPLGAAHARPDPRDPRRHLRLRGRRGQRRPRPESAARPPRADGGRGPHDLRLHQVLRPCPRAGESARQDCIASCQIAIKHIFPEVTITGLLPAFDYVIPPSTFVGRSTRIPSAATWNRWDASSRWCSEP